jgi:RNA polymerase sigma-70 factor, ECF subfamily
VNGADDEISALIAGTASGDRHSFRRLYERTAPKLLGVALRILRDRATAEDAVQEAFVKVWHAADQFRPTRGSGLAWLVTIQRNKAIDVLRSRRAPAAGLDAAVDLPDPAPGPAARAEASDERRRIDACLGELAPERADAVRSAYLEGHTYQDLARSHGVPLNTMRTWLRRALILLRECLSR